MRQRLTLGECRSDGRTIIGTALRYGERSPAHAEYFEPGAITLGDGVNRWLNLHHNPLAAIAWTDGGGLTLRDTGEALELEARAPAIPAGDLAIKGLEERSLGGLSVEFRAESERRDGDTRVIERAALAGVGLVANPSYPGSLAEVRGEGWELRARGVSSTVPYKRSLGCQCPTGIKCEAVEFDAGSFGESLADDLSDVLAVAGDFGKPLASRSAGTLKLNNTAKGLNVQIPRLPDSEAARDLIATAASVPIYGRPVFVPAAGTEVVEREGQRVAIVREARLRAITFGTTDVRQGWTAAEFPELENRREIARPSDDEYRKALLWL